MSDSSQAKKSPLLMAGALLALLLILVLVAGAVFLGITRLTSGMSLQNARELWDARTFDRYQIVLLSDSFKQCRAEYIVEGQEIGQVLNPDLPLGCTIYTVEELFRIIETTPVGECGPNGCECDGRVALDVEYHPELGYPLHIRAELRKPLIQAPRFGPQLGCTMIGWIGENLIVESFTPLP